MYYTRDPYRTSPPGEMGFLQSCFSFLFGDGDPNGELGRRRARAVAALIRAQGGAVTAEQLAPLLEPTRMPPTDADEGTAQLAAGVAGSFSESWVPPPP